MTVPKVLQKAITQTIDAVQWTAHGDDAEAGGGDARANVHLRLSSRRACLRRMAAQYGFKP